MNYQQRLIPFKRMDVTTLDQLLPGDVFARQNKPNEAFQCINFTVDKWGEITGCLVAPRLNLANERILRHPKDITAIYLRTLDENEQ